MIHYNIYPGGVKNVVTFSFDDGPENDKRLISLFDKYSLKSTFHLNGMNYQGMSEDELEQVRKIYENHEISCHTFMHGWPTQMAGVSLVAETIKDREILEKIAGYPVMGMSYPSGMYNDEIISTMEKCGIQYSRTIDSTNAFNMPEKFMEWHPTCHFSSALPLAESFMTDLECIWSGPLLYVWGHSYELNTEEKWSEMEKLMRTVAHNDNIWYATNMEIFDYVTAQKMLKISYDETVFYNPTATDVWVEKDKSVVIKIPAGETIKL